MMDRLPVPLSPKGIAHTVMEMQARWNYFYCCCRKSTAQTGIWTPKLRLMQTMYMPELQAQK